MVYTIFTTLIFLSYLVHGRNDLIVSGNVQSEEKEHCSLNSSKLICSKGVNGSYLYDRSNVLDLTLYDWPDDIFDLSYITTYFKSLKKLHICQSKISFIYGSRNQNVTSLQELNISNINLKDFSLPLLTALTSFDISNNFIEYFTKEDFIMMPQLQELYLAGNPIKCNSNMQWLLDNSQKPFIRLLDESNTFCSNENYKDKSILGIMKLFEDMEKDCPSLCKCALDKVVGDLVPIISVNCNNLSLSNFPERIPVNTTILLLKHNKIRDVMPLVTDKQYSNVKDVFLDYNEIKTIDVLEGSYWLNNFRLVSLQGNAITQLHTYSLDNAFKHNQYLMRVYFGFNPWKCDCNFATNFRELLLKYQDQVKDINDIRCSNHENNENSLLPIAELPINAFCIDNSLPLHPLDYLSIVFASLTLLILGNLCYDWWHFKSTGKVPWIVAHMP